MRGRAFHPAGFVSSYLKASYLREDHSFLGRCRNHLLKNILPTLFIVICSSVITLFLSGLIDQAKPGHDGANNARGTLNALQGDADRLP